MSNTVETNNNLKIFVIYKQSKQEQQINEFYSNNYNKQYILDKHGIELLDYNKYSNNVIVYEEYDNYYFNDIVLRESEEYDNCCITNYISNIVNFIKNNFTYF